MEVLLAPAGFPREGWVWKRQQYIGDPDAPVHDLEFRADAQAFPLVHSVPSVPEATGGTIQMFREGGGAMTMSALRELHARRPATLQGVTSRLQPSQMAPDTGDRRERQTALAAAAASSSNPSNPS